ncbi:Bifunctional protein HldE OS=Stutzerimonas stutzeri OX=316 GN=hldE PE=3 SV=1 [Stutzerimonas stutzeri]
MDFEEPFRTDAEALARETEALLDQVRRGPGAVGLRQGRAEEPPGADPGPARKRNIPVLADPEGKDFSIYRGASLITPNLSEFEPSSASYPPGRDQLVAKGLKLLGDLDWAPCW